MLYCNKTEIAQKHIDIHTTFHSSYDSPEILFRITNEEVLCQHLAILQAVFFVTYRI